MGNPIFIMPLAGSTWSPERRYPGGTDGTAFDVYFDGDVAGNFGTSCNPTTDYITDVITNQAALFDLLSGTMTGALIDGKVKFSRSIAWTWDMTDVGDETNHQFWGLASSATISGTLSGGLYSYTFPYLPAGVWYPGVGATEDTRNRRNYKGQVTKSIDGDVRIVRWHSTPKKERVMTFRYVDKQYALAEYESLAPENNSYEQFFDYVSAGNTFRMATDASSPSWSTYILNDISDPIRANNDSRGVYWDITVSMTKI